MLPVLPDPVAAATSEDVTSPVQTRDAWQCRERLRSQLADIITTLPSTSLPALASAVIRRDISAVDRLADDLELGAASPIDERKQQNSSWWASLLQRAQCCGLSSATIAGSVSVCTIARATLASPAH